jgi:hypothetical protein
MGIGQIISDTFGMVKQRFGQLIGIWAVYFAATMGLFIVMGIVVAVGVGAAGAGSLATMAEGNALAAGGGMILFVVLFYAAYLLVIMAQYASLIAMASPLARPSFSDALGAGWRAAPALLLLMLVLIIAYFAVAMGIGLVGTAFSGMGTWVPTLLLLLMFPLLVWIGSRLAPLFAVVAVDGVRNPFKAIARSWQMTKGRALTIFLASLVFMLILVVICGLLLLPSIGMFRTMSDPGSLASAQPALGGIALLFLGITVAGVLFTVCYSAFQAVIHGSLSNAAGEGAAEAFV